MSLRLIQVVIPENNPDSVELLLDGHPPMCIWTNRHPEKGISIQLLVRADACEPILDRFEQRFADTEGFFIVLTPVEAALPRLKETEKNDEDSPEKPEKKIRASVSREELYSEVISGIQITRTFVAMVILSSLVAAVGLMRNDIAVIIGAMVIAPLLTPNVALATTLADTDLAKNSLRTNMLGFTVALFLSIILGILFHVDPEIPAIQSRTRIGISDIVLALSAGAAGTMALTRGTVRHTDRGDGGSGTYVSSGYIRYAPGSRIY